MTDNGSPIPSARIDDLDLDNEGDREIWEQRLQSLAKQRLAQARARLESMGIIDQDGKLRSEELPPDMQDGSESSVDTR